jgi:hypothetical protein
LCPSRPHWKQVILRAPELCAAPELAAASGAFAPAQSELLCPSPPHLKHVIFFFGLPSSAQQAKLVSRIPRALERLGFRMVIHLWSAWVGRPPWHPHPSPFASCPSCLPVHTHQAPSMQHQLSLVHLPHVCVPHSRNDGCRCMRATAACVESVVGMRQHASDPRRASPPPSTSRHSRRRECNALRRDGCSGGTWLGGSPSLPPPPRRVAAPPVTPITAKRDQRCRALRRRRLRVCIHITRVSSLGRTDGTRLRRLRRRSRGLKPPTRGNGP